MCSLGDGGTILLLNFNSYLTYRNYVFNIDIKILTIKGVIRVRHTVKQRREKLINKLIAFDIFKKEDKQLFELTLSELQYMYNSVKSYDHPHSEFGSIQWT
jgi:hypothetical protein